MTVLEALDLEEALRRLEAAGLEGTVTLYRATGMGLVELLSRVAEDVLARVRGLEGELAGRLNGWNDGYEEGYEDGRRDDGLEPRRMMHLEYRTVRRATPHDVAIYHVEGPA